ncbi:uncharacterized protein SPSC_05291 [Sporisorium scitamineum]|uniref:PH domain-containing protein n=1 Tax=Sporisorium scitamineum TaxID=49012 RepID=A0A127ZH05_9BASI|nr:uncharacterized protein SPSC_05291 [Sporisorium scitamineum]
MSTSMQSHRYSRAGRPTPHPAFESYDLAHSSHARSSYRNDEDLFDTLFPQPPPRSRLQAERLARPSLPSLKPSLHLDSADSSRSTAQLLSSSNSIESVNSLSSYPSSTSSLSLLHSIHPNKQASTDSSIDYYSPAISDVNSADTDHSVSSGRAQSQSSEIDSHEQAGPFTPLTPNGPAQAWRPKELNLVRKRQAPAPAESSLPLPQATPSWNSTPTTISADRNALLIGLGLGGVSLDPLPPAPSNVTAQPSGLSRSKSPQLVPSSAFSRDAYAYSNAAPAPAAHQGPKQLILVSSSGPPAVRRFPGRRPSEALHETFSSPTPPPVSEASSRSTTPQMRSAIPVLPSGPAFVANRALSPDVTSTSTAERHAGLSAQEFLAQIASTPEYQASEYFDSAAFGASPAVPFFAQHDQGLVLDRSDDPDAIEAKSEGTPTLTTSSADAASVLTAKAPGFSWTQRSRAASLSKRKPPPAPLVFTSSPATSASDTLPGSAGGRRRRSPSATINQRSPLSAPHSGHSGADAKPAIKTSSSASSGSNHRLQDSVSDYSEPLRTAFYDFETDDEADEHGMASKPSSEFKDSKTAVVLPSASTTDATGQLVNSTESVQSGRAAALEHYTSDLQASRYSAVSSRITSLGSEAQDRQSSGSGSAPAFEFDDLETESAGESLSFETMMGLLQRQDSHKASNASSVEDAHSEQCGQGWAASNAADSTITQAASTSPRTAVSPNAKQDERAEPLATGMAAPAVPSFNISIFGPGQSSAAAHAPSPPSSPDRKKVVQEAQGASVPPSPGASMPPSRKQSIVPAPPSFAIHAASCDEGQAAGSGILLPAITHGIDARPAAMERANSNDLGNSRWSSGSESDGDAAMSIRNGRKSFSKGRKSFSSSRKNNVPFVREPTMASSFDSMPENGRRQSRSSKTRLSGSSAAAIAQTQPAPSKPSMSKRLLLNGLPSFRKKSFSNLSGQSTSPSTPNSSRQPVSAGLPFPGATEIPFPTSGSPQSTSAPPLPGMTSRRLDRAEPPQLSIKTAFASTFASANLQPVQSPRTPISAPGFASSIGASGPLTTQQILAQARSNVWPENYIGTSVSAAGMTSPYLSAAQDTFNHSFVPSRLAPTPPYSGSAFRLGWSSAPHTSSMPQSPRFAGTASQDKSLPGTPIDEAPVMPRSRSRTAEIAPPKNLRHMRQSSSNSNLDKMSKDVPADLFRPSHAKTASVTRSELAVPAPPLDTSAADEEKLSTISEFSTLAASVDKEASELIDVVELAASIPILVDRKQAKLKKARRIRKQNDRFARYNSWTEYGLRWVTEQGHGAFDRLAAEGLPSSAILAAAGAPSGRSQTRFAGGSGGGGDGDDDSDGSDTDDYGSSDGGGGGGGFGGFGGGGGGRHPGKGRDDADNSEDEDEEEESDEDEEPEAMTDEDSEDDYGAVEQSSAARSRRAHAMPAVPSRNASMPATAGQAEDAADSDSSDDRPLGELVNDPKALQKALRAKERKRHFDLAAQALEGKSSSADGHARRAVRRQSQGQQANDAAVNPNELSQRLAKVQGRRERAQAQAQAPNAAIMQRSQTVARQEVGRSAAATVSRSKSVRTTPAERYAHPGMRARTPSEAALRAKAMVQAMPHGPSPISPTLPNMGKMPELPSNAMAAVVAAQKAMAHAQANPTPAALAQAQALATSATAALNAATAQVKRTGSSPISPTFNAGEPMAQTATSPCMVDGAEFPGARHRANSRGHALPMPSSSGPGAAAPALASAHQPGMLQRLRSRSVSRNQAPPMPIDIAAAPPMPDLPRPSTASKDSQASSSPHSSHAPTFAALSQAAMHHGRPSVDSSTAHGDASMQRMPSALPGNVSASHDGSFSHSMATSEPRQPHKVFILSRQRFTVVEVPVSARARDLALEVVDRERLPMDDSKGGWVVFDCSAQLGIERPLREYEMITDVVNVRAHPRTDYFLIKRTELSPYLSIRSVPSSSPALAGWVYVQDRKKKWNKRWLELRDHGLYHAKNEKGKDETPICQISTFDVYLVDSSAIKMPKANGFALRSQDPITMFEKPEQDYMHYFCLTDPAAHRDWVRAILNARTYILRQEKAVLFQIDSPPTSQDAGAGGGLSRKNTSRRPNGRPAAAAAASVEAGNTSATGPSPTTPLIDSSAFAGPFAKGSLLADKAISDAKEALRGHAAVAPPTGAFNDLSLMERNAVRSNEARRREEAIERQRRMKADGQPLIDLARK